MGFDKVPYSSSVKLSFSAFNSFPANKGYIKILHDGYTKWDNDDEIKIFWGHLKVPHFMVAFQGHLGVYMSRRKARPTAEHNMQWMTLKHAINGICVGKPTGVNGSGQWKSGAGG